MEKQNKVILAIILVVLFIIVMGTIIYVPQTEWFQGSGFGVSLSSN